MFKNAELQKHLELSNSVESANVVVAEWNMNVPGNIEKLGNYRYRQSDTRFAALPNFYDPDDSAKFYTGATNSDVSVEYGLKKDESTPLLFTYPKDKEKLYYSLEECIKPIRPRSGINKLSYFNTNSIPSLSQSSYSSTFVRPRYYMPTKDDEFKYWRSYRTESDLNIQVPSTVSKFATLSLISRIDANTTTATMSRLDSVSELPVGKIFSAKTVLPITFGGTRTVQSPVFNSELGIWTANLIGFTAGSTSNLRVGDSISAIDGIGVGAGKLKGPNAKEVLVTSISSTSITYSFIGGSGSGPVAGTVTNLITVSGDITPNEARVVEIINPTTVIVEISGTTDPKPGTISEVYINKYNTNQEYGISKNSFNGIYDIQDCNPFVVYKKEVPANRLVLKVQTNVGDEDLGPFRDSAGSPIPDPFFGELNKTVPKRFSIQYLTPENIWVDALSFDDSSTRPDGSPIFGPDGHLELEYGIVVPDLYKNNFTFLGTLKSAALKPDKNSFGAAYLITEDDSERGLLYIYNGVDYDEPYPVEYTWSIKTDGDYGRGKVARQLVNPVPFQNSNDGTDIYREFVWIKGIRVAVKTMNKADVPLELIEISPRLVADLSELVISLDVKKSLSDLSSSALPVGSLIAGTGSLELFDPEQTFNTNNSWKKQEKTGSIVAEYYDKRIKFIFYEVIKRVNKNNYYIPLKTLYTDGFPERNAQEYTVALNLRDLYFHFESIKAPRLLITDVSLSQAIAILLDATGFSNYVFKRVPGISDPVIPYFFVPPDQNVAEVLGQLAVATQSAMFFDEYNNFVVMTKEYLLGDREVDLELLGEPIKVDNKITKLPNIISIASQNKEIYNAGEITYISRYIKKGARKLSQARFVDRDYVYSPSILWEASGTEAVRSQNSQQQTAFALSAVPLNTTLTNAVPTVKGGVLIDNEFDVGENSYWLSRFQGFLYANGEIIKYDAVEYTITGPPIVDNNGRSLGNTVWISNNKEYQKYFAKMPFNGKIYPTGLVRIYAEPFYETIGDQTFLKNGQVVRHGRGQFGTPIVNHSAGLSDYWSDPKNVRGCVMDSNLLYTTKLSTEREIPPTKLGPAGVDNQKANSSSRTGIIRNFMSSKYYSESELKSLKTTQAGTTQSSAFVVTGPDFSQTATPQDFVTYIHKPMEGAYKHLGTRLRIIGKVESSSDKSQTVVGGMTYFNITGDDATQNVSIGGGSAGINLVNPDTNNGYYFELAALTSSDASNFLKKNEDGDATVSIENILFYKVEKNNNSGILFQGNPDSVSIKSIDSSTSITYTVLGGGTPIAGTVGNPRTIPDPEIIIGSSTVSDISKVSGKNAWDAKLINVPSTVFGLRVGDSITATNESGKLFGGSPTSVKITAIGSNDISYRVTGGATPVAGTVTAAKTVPGSAIRFGDKNPKAGKIGNIKEETVSTVPAVVKKWTVKLTGLKASEVSKLRVGDKITATSGEQDKAVPTRLWGGIGSVVVDDGNFAGQGRYLAEANPTVYDLAMEYVDVSSTRRDFYLYINQKLVQKVTDTKPIAISNPSMGLFVRGTSKAMFENVYALSKNYANNTVFDTNAPIAPVFGDRDSLVNASEALSKYAISGAIQETYLSGINPANSTSHKLYYEEFGTIMRECAYFNIKYDRAYPAFFARIAPTFNRTRGYTVSGFTADSYGAEFLVFNNTDTVLTLDDKSSNYLRIQGITFTQDTSNTITVDDYLKQKGDLSDPEFKQNGSVQSPDRFIEAYEKIRLSRIQYGKNEFSLNSTYIQDAETAEDVLGWIIDKNVRPRKLVGLNIFSNPTIQLGDVVSIKYDNNEGIGLIDSNPPKYVVYNIEYNKSVDGPDMSVYLSEV